MGLPSKLQILRMKFEELDRKIERNLSTGGKDSELVALIEEQMSVEEKIFHIEKEISK